MPKGTAFVAYSSSDRQLADLIFDSVRRANSKEIPIKYEPWEFNDIAGQPLISPIMARIEESAYVVADITFLNLNVVYEIGFSIGKAKRVFLVRNSKIAGDKSLANDVGIFDTLGYYEYADFGELTDRLVAHIDVRPITVDFALNRKAPVYVVEPPTRNAAVTISVSRIKKTGLKYRSYNPGEDPRLSASDAIRQVSCSSGIVSFLQTDSLDGAHVNNVRAMFVAGLADGMVKPNLILAPVGYTAPLDVRDTVKYFTDERDIRETIAEFAPDFVGYLTQSDEAKSAPQSLLASLTMGDPTAENEMTTLQAYYLKTDTYSRAVRGEVNLVVGRKGSGKTALFIQLRDKIRSDKRNIVVDLKPEGYQLLKLKEEMLIFLSRGAREHLLVAFWEYLILLEVAYKILEKDRNTYKHNHDVHDQYLDLQASYSAQEFAAEGDFSERLFLLSNVMTAKYKDRFGETVGNRLTNEHVTELLHMHDIRTLRDKISKYLEKKGSVWILFDNLDKGWSTQGVEVLDAVILRCLIDAGRRVEREMRRAGREFHCIVFVRNDVYDHVMKFSADYGKEMRATLDWSDHDLLREVIRLRLQSGLRVVGESVEFFELWKRVCVTLHGGEETSAYFIKHSLMRPRNLLKIFNHCKGFAVNLGHQIIEREDIEKGLRAYSQDLLSELDHELTDVLPIASNVIYQFIDSVSELSSVEIKVLLREANVEPEKVDEVVNFLMYYGIIGVKAQGQEFFIYDVAYNEQVLKMRAGREGDQAVFIINPAFWPALEVRESRVRL